MSRSVRHNYSQLDRIRAAFNRQGQNLIKKITSNRLVLIVPILLRYWQEAGSDTEQPIQRRFVLQEVVDAQSTKI